MDENTSGLRLGSPYREFAQMEAVAIHQHAAFENVWFRQLCRPKTCCYLPLDLGLAAYSAAKGPGEEQPCADCNDGPPTLRLCHGQHERDDSHAHLQHRVAGGEHVKLRYTYR